MGFCFMVPLTRLGSMLLAGFLACSFPAVSRADPVLPSADPKAERVLVGTEDSEPEKAAARGRWQVQPTSVATLDRSAPMGWFWLAGGQGAWFDNGTIRARFETDGRVEATLLLRARADQGGRRLQRALGLRICGRFAWLVAVKNGRVRLLEHKVLIKQGKRQAIEVIVNAFGPHLVASLYDAKSREHLATISAHDVPGRAGAVGLMAGCNRNKPAARTTWLATRPACSSIPVGQPEGPPVVVWSPSSQDAQIAEKVEAAIELETSSDKPAVTTWRTDPIGLETLFCAGHKLLRAATDLPWKYLDLALLKRMGRPPEQTPTGFRLEHSTKDPVLVEALLRGWSVRYPKRTRLEVLGKTRQGRPILALAVADDLEQASDRPAALINGAHHGDEVLSTEFVLDAIAQLVESEGEDMRRIRKQIVVWCVPLVNPDGLHAFVHDSIRAGRKNGRDLDGDGRRAIDEGVDLNRNYPFQWGQLRKGSSRDSRFYRGPKPASEPETQAMIRLADREHFVASLSYHMGTVAILAPYTIDRVENPKPNEAWLVAEQVARELDPLPNGKTFTVRRKLYSVDGVDQDWLRHAHGTLALLVEGSPWPPPLEVKRRTSIVRAVRSTWKDLLIRFLDGPSLSARVRTPDGNPARVEVRLLDQALKAGELWTTRARDGRFDRFLPQAGTVRVGLFKDGKLLLERSLDVGDERVRVELELPASGRGN
jgi:hypothetical protein